MSMLRYVTAGLVAATVFAAAPAMAVTQIPNGTVSAVGLSVPTVTIGASTSTFSASIPTAEIAAGGGFAGAAGKLGSLSGSLTFSNTLNTVVPNAVSNFFSFAGANNSTFEFSTISAKTISFSDAPGSSSFSLYLLGNTVNTVLGYGSTLTSLTLSFNSTGGSPYSVAATLAVPPSAPSVPEPATWAMTLIGFGAMGAALRRRPRTSVSFA
jgi:hypothetical protein